jgi:hypothetical protein
VDHGVNLAKVRLGPLMANYMTQESDTPSSKTTLVWIQLQIYFPEFEENGIQMLQMLSPILTVHIEIVDKYL